MNMLNKSDYGKHFFRSILFILFIFSMMSFGDYMAKAQAADGKVTILHTNDMHSHFLGFGPNHEYSPLSLDDDGTVGGIARIAGKVNDIRDEREITGIPVLLVDAGDFMMGTAFTLLKGEMELSLMAHMGYNAITIGNHEFDWSPAETAAIYGHIPGLGLTLPVVASNLIFDNEDDRDDALKALWDDDVIRAYHTEVLDNGIKVGYFGLIGDDAISVAPFASPVQFEDQAIAALAMVAVLEGAGVELIVCLSHSGIEEDSELAAAVPGIDVIISGHTHEKTESPVIVGDTIIVQSGSYTRFLGVLNLDLTAGVVSVDKFDLVTIDDTVMGDADAHDMVEDFQTQLDNEELFDLGYTFAGKVAETEFDLTATAGEEGNLGNLVTDAMRWMVDQIEQDDTVDFAIESNGVIRDNILKGSSSDKNIAFSDAFRVLPLGSGFEGDVGYPMVTIYVYAYEVKRAMEVLTTVYPLMGSDYWLNISGLRVEYFENGIPFFRVRNIYVGDDINGYADTPLNTSRLNRELYKVAINYYLGSMISVVGDYTYGILEVIPKDKEGRSYMDEAIHPNGLAEARVDTDLLVEGVQELQQWKGFMDYFGTFEDDDEDEVNEIPADRYEGPTGRITKVSCFISAAGFRY